MVQALAEISIVSVAGMFSPAAGASIVQASISCHEAH